jgi:cytochrome c-type biogenesis protein CcmH/NrfG
MPNSLRRYYTRVRRGRPPLTQRDRREIAELQRALPSDPRPTLVLARHFVDINYYRDAVQRYERAFRMDPSCRGDRRMLSDLIELSTSPAVRAPAQDLIGRAYGRDALAAVERALEQTRDREQLTALSALRDYLRTLPDR